MEFFVVMQKRLNGVVFADLHKTDLTIYLEKRDANEALAKITDEIGLDPPTHHVVRLIASVPENKQ